MEGLFLAIMPLLLVVSFCAARDPRTATIIGLAWNTGGVTTGPVTVPMMIALGIGVSRIAGRGHGPAVARAILEMGLGVPSVSYGEGMGLRGSTDWRRRSTPNQSIRGADGLQTEKMARFMINCEEGRSSTAVRAALEKGAGGATLSRRSHRSVNLETPEEEQESVAMVSHARECCDLIIPANLLEPIEEAVIASGLFEKPAKGFIEIGKVNIAVSNAE